MTPRFAHMMPAEWAKHDAYWLAWPADGALWLENLAPAQTSWLKMARAIGEKRTSGAPAERLEILVHPDVDDQTVHRMLSELGDVDSRIHRIPYGDIWLRDTAPLFMRGRDGTVSNVRFRFNGWGGKYVLVHDDNVAERIAQAADMPSQAFEWILEGGAVEVNGEGLCLTTESCLLNPNRGVTERGVIEAHLCEALGVEKVAWLRRGLNFDHTDGHVDNIARFVSEDTVVCMRQSSPTDPHADAYPLIREDLLRVRNTKGTKLNIVEVPSPGVVLSTNGEPMPASYLNFIIANHTVVVPVYGTAHDEAALKVLESLFKGRRIVPVEAYAILSGGGAFHCISQQQPSQG